MKFQAGDLVKPAGPWPPNSRLGGIELALVVSFLWGLDNRVEIQVLGGKKNAMRLSTWDFCLQKVEK